MSKMPAPKHIESIRTRPEEKLTPKQLNSYLKREGLTKDEWAKILGVSVQAVHLWTSGDRDFSVTNTRLVRLFQKYPQLLKEF